MRREDQRRHRRIGTEHEHPRGPEDRVADEAADRRVQPVHRGHAGQLGVGHALRHEDRGEHDARDEVGPQPGALGTRARRAAPGTQRSIARGSLGVVSSRGSELSTGSGFLGGADHAMRGRDFFDVALRQRGPSWAAQRFVRESRRARCVMMLRPGALLVVGVRDVPRGPLGVARGEHRVPTRE